MSYVPACKFSNRLTEKKKLFFYLKIRDFFLLVVVIFDKKIGSHMIEKTLYSTMQYDTIQP